ncbi:phosphoribosyltransferase-like protein [Fimicolochytrium jonesii]|uniref:phosphoribosyltransferase-like protein n=1 Tax=Fimicolochytrium jonesii TaxID=1396493 RepID=UPI0022FF17EA|nr:phosphoribosyltransferase-like protein [Fimicolochytrium jonesii]KAI8816802.1 phosphoribosyltransferase-like protein [Fimicolochytrium jonesii]
MSTDETCSSNHTQPRRSSTNAPAVIPARSAPTVGSSLTTPVHRAYLSLIDRTGHPRFDISPLWNNPSALNELISDIVAYFPIADFDRIVALDALGFILGGALAIRTGRPLVTVRKGGKLPLDFTRKVAVTFMDHDGEKTMEVRRDLVPPEARLLLVDEWIGTGAQVKHVAAMLKELECVVVGVATVYCFPDHDGAMEIARTFKLFAANCLVCTYFECRCN